MIDRILRRIEDILHIAGCLSLAAVAVLINLDIILRVLFGIPVQIQFEFTELYLMPALASLSLSWVYRDGGHLALEFMPERMPGPFGWLIGKIRILLPMLFFMAVTYMSGKFALTAFGHGAVEYGAIDWPLAWAYAVVPLGCGVLVLRLMHDALLGRQGVQA